MSHLQIAGVQNKEISVDGSTVKITKGKSLINASREKIIPIASISGVEVKKPGAMVRGYIQIQTAGQNSGNSTYTLTGGAFDAAQDENAVLFSKKEDYETALAIQKYVLEHGSTPSSPSFSGADEIAKFKSLLDQGAITEAEFEAKKKQLLGI